MKEIRLQDIEFLPSLTKEERETILSMQKNGIDLSPLLRPYEERDKALRYRAERIWKRDPELKKAEGYRYQKFFR